MVNRTLLPMMPGLVGQASSLSSWFEKNCNTTGKMPVPLNDGQPHAALDDARAGGTGFQPVQLVGKKICNPTGKLPVPLNDGQPHAAPDDAGAGGTGFQPVQLVGKKTATRQARCLSH
jgi:hypothetical protein